MDRRRSDRELAQLRGWQHARRLCWLLNLRSVIAPTASSQALVIGLLTEPPEL